MFVWMIYVIAVSLLLGFAALAAEQAARLRRAPTRWIWALAIVFSLLVPTVIASVSVQMPDIFAPTVKQKVVALREVTSARLSPLFWVDDRAQTASAWRKADPLLKRCWLAASAVMVLALIFSGAHLLWRRQRWHSTTLEGADVYVTADVGPAVVGLLSPRIVVPRWLLENSSAQQAAVIAHEQSHLEAGDPRLLTAALCLLVFMPWNLPLWWQLQRLRHAIEVDCDRRVLRAGHDARRYSQTLIEVGQKQSAYLGAVAAMSESKSFLEQRIQIMLRSRGKWWRASAAALACLAVAVVAVATQVSPPNAGGDPGQQAAQAATQPPQSGERVAITLDKQILGRYVGTYSLHNTLVLKITLDANQLLAQLTSQPAIPIYPQSTTEFFYKAVDAQISFEAQGQDPATALVLHQRGQNMNMPRISPAEATQIEETLAARIHSKTPNPQSEVVLRQMVDHILSGKPSNVSMTPAMAEIARKQGARVDELIKSQGALLSVDFMGVGPQGGDRYAVKQEHGTWEWTVVLDDKGVLEGLAISAVQ